MSLKEVKRTAAVAWSPPQQTPPLLATGTLAGALDASFSTLAELEIHELNLDDKSNSTVTQKSVITAAARFNRLAWSSFSTNSQDGVIIGGCEDGSISLWNVSELLKAPNNEAALIARCEAHHGAVRGLQVNPFQANLVASGAAESEIWLWDLNNLNQPYAPGANKSAKLEDVTDLAWNRIVPHILAASSNSGYTVVWDLKSRKEVLQLSASGQRTSISALAWNPENATQILVASDDDQSPVIYAWDLRNARAPEKTLSGHSKGILSMAWCPKDAELLLSCGKDNKSTCWNPKTGSVIADLTLSDNWLFDVQWCPRNPDLFSTASFSGIVQVNSFQNLMSGGSRPTGTATNANEDFFAMASAGMAQRSAVPSHVQIPKWLRRPIGVAFGFGGRLVTFSSLKGDNFGRMITIVSTIVPSQEKLVRESTKLDSALSSHMMVDYCAEKIPAPVPNLHASDGDAVFWNVAKVMFESNPQAKLMNLLGFDRQKLEDKIRVLSLEESAKSQSSNSPSRVEEASKPRGPLQYESSPLTDDKKYDELFQSSPESGEQFDFNSLVQSGEAQSEQEAIPPSSTAVVEGGGRELATSHLRRTSSERRGTFQGVPFALFGPECSEIDRVITKAIILGNFEAAVDLCVKADRLSDALLVAICGGEELVAKTQQIYFQKARFPYLRVVSGIVKKDLSDVVQHADVDNWEEILALICSYASGPTFSQLCNILGNRLEAALSKNRSFVTPALICFMAGGNSASAISLVLSETIKIAPDCNSIEYAHWLEGLVEKARVLEQVTGYLAPQEAIPVQDSVPAISDKFIEYSYVMANNGLLEIAVRYFNSFSNQRELTGEDDAVSVFGDRLAQATKMLNLPIRPVPQLYQRAIFDVAPEAVGRPGEQQSPLQAQPQWGAQQSQALPPTTQSPFGIRPSPGRQPSIPMPGEGLAAVAPQHGMQPSGFGRPPMQPSGFGGPQTQTSGFGGPQTQTSGFGGPQMMPSVPGRPPMMPGMPPAPPGPTTHGMPPPMPGMSSFAHPSQSAGSTTSQSPTQPPPMMSQFVAPPTIPQGRGVPAPGQGQGFPPMPTQSTQAIYAPAPSMPPVPTPPAVPAMPTMPTHAAAPPVLSTPPQGSTSPRPPMIPQPAMPSIPPMPTITTPPAGMVTADGSAYSRRATGAYNDPPMVAARIPSGTPSMQVPTSPVQPSPSSGHISMPPAQVSPSNAPPQAAAASPMPPVVKTSPGPVDPSKIPSNLQPIYRTFTTLIQQCQERALPMQRRVVEDSAKRMQALFHQLCDQELSQPVVQILNDMCSNINGGQYDRAHELHTPLMTNYFAEAGAWILAAKRLIEVAKICLQ